MRVNKDGTGKTNIGPRGFRQLADIKIQKYGYGMPGGCIYACIFFFSLSIYGEGVLILYESKSVIIPNLRTRLMTYRCGDSFTCHR